jgi:LPXTG-site transpeptidase (sortase) family protein
MQKKIVGRKIIITLLLTCILSLTFLSYVMSTNKVEAISASINPKTTILPEESIGSPGLPRYLLIPKIKLTANIEYVRVTKEGAMDVPKIIQNVAWYELGVRPGDIGSAVIAGHYGWKNGKSSAFDNVSKLKKGDMVYIKDDNGTIISFVVQKKETYDSTASAEAIFMSNDGKSHLNLITCSGTWNAVEKKYSSRTIIFTNRVQ